MPYGFSGKVLIADLSGGRTSVEEYGEDFYRKYLGGGLLGGYIVFRGSKAGVEALQPGNVMVCAPSVVTGVPVPGLSRYAVVAKSPLTGGIGESQAGGHWGPELKRAGFDAVVVLGAAESPVYLLVTDGHAEIRDASGLAGRKTAEVEELLRTDLGDRRIRVLQTGPAGERLVRFAGVCSDVRYYCGRGGLGAVMGSKNLKAIAVRGAGTVRVKDEEGLHALARDFSQNFRKHPNERRFHDLGTSSSVTALNATGMLPTRNFQTTAFEGAQHISGQAIHDLMFRRQEGCYACPVRCKRTVASDGPMKISAEYGGPEYETCASLGSYLGISDPFVVAKGNEICNSYGLDSISTGGVIAFAMECFEQGLLTVADTDGLELRFGNGAAALKLIEMIANRHGIGDLLAEGSARAAERIGRGAEEFVMACKGQEFPAHTPRVKPSLGLAYATLPIGADHMSASQETLVTPEAPDFFADALKPLGLLDRLELSSLDASKVRFFWYTQVSSSVRESLTICHLCFAPLGYFPSRSIVDIVESVTGWSTSTWELMKAGERRINLLKAFNVREGVGAERDVLPRRMFQPIPDGPAAGNRISETEFARAVKTLYAMSGWDPETGVPLRAKLEELDLGWVADELDERRG